MKTNYPLLFCFFLLYGAGARAQNIRNDTIALNTSAVVELIFPSPPGGDIISNDGDYRVTPGSKKSLLLQALKKDAPARRLIIKEQDKRKHRFVLIYREEIDAKPVDWSSLKNLKDHTRQKQEEVKKLTALANQLYDRGQTDEALPKYKWLLNEVEEQNEGAIALRIADIEKRKAEDREKNYADAMTKAVRFAEQKAFREADKEFKRALGQKPGDTVATTRSNANAVAWFADCTARAKQAHRSKNYIAEKAAYDEARTVNPKDFGRLEADYRQAETLANGQVHDQQVDKGDAAFRLKDWSAARLAYDSANAAKQDPYCAKQLKEVARQMATDEKSREDEMEYYRILSRAKKIAGLKQYDSAIAEYEKAQQLFKNRQFPKDRITALKEMKNTSVGKQ